ncbi:MAG: nickel pincer cofactor biosynthesis protein LarB [Planctomycetota bacterium]
MNGDELRELLGAVRDGRAGLEDAVERLAGWPALDLGHSRLDLARHARCGAPEVVYGAGKSPRELVDNVGALAGYHGRALATRVSDEAAAALLREVPGATHHARARCVSVGAPPPGVGDVLVVSAGTSDGPVAEEALLVARFHGAHAETISDVGVAGIHRLLDVVERLRAADVLIVVAGMEGALPSVIGGLVDRPVIAVPTSVGYGASLGGVAALLAMLNSCAAGVTVVNIDNGFGAGVAAARIVRLAAATPARDSAAIAQNLHQRAAEPRAQNQGNS